MKCIIEDKKSVHKNDVQDMHVRRTKIAITEDQKSVFKNDVQQMQLKKMKLSLLVTSLNLPKAKIVVLYLVLLMLL